MNGAELLEKLPTTRKEAVNVHEISILCNEPVRNISRKIKQLKKYEYVSTELRGTPAHRTHYYWNKKCGTKKRKTNRANSTSAVRYEE